MRPLPDSIMQVDAHDALDEFERVVEERLRPIPARGVDEDPRPIAGRVVLEGRDRRVVGHVEGDEARLAAVPGDERTGGLATLPVHVADEDPRAPLRQREHRGPPDARRATGHDGALPRQLHGDRV
jgi:hypothetical protein